MVLIQLLLPTTGAAAGDTMTLLVQTRRELVNRFKGVTAYVRSPAKGLWTAPDGRTEADDVVMVEVVTETFGRTWWRTYAAVLAHRFSQDTIHVRALPVEVPDEGGCMSKPFAIVTGASSGIGLELAAICAEEGFDLLVAADRPEIHTAADRFRSQGSQVTDVARVGFNAMMRGDGDVVSGWKNKLQSAIANITPAGVLAEQHRKMA
jgi:short chain dehydrogenase